MAFQFVTKPVFSQYNFKCITTIVLMMIVLKASVDCAQSMNEIKIGKQSSMPYRSSTPKYHPISTVQATTNHSDSSWSRFLVKINVTRTIWLVFLVIHSIYLPVLVAYLLALKASRLHSRSQVFSEKAREQHLKNSKFAVKEDDFVLPAHLKSPENFSFDSMNVSQGIPTQQPKPDMRMKQRPIAKQSSSAMPPVEAKTKTNDEFYDATFTNTVGSFPKMSMPSTKSMSGSQQDSPYLGSSMGVASGQPTKNLIKQKDNFVNFDNIDKSIDPFNNDSKDNLSAFTRSYSDTTKSKQK